MNPATSRVSWSTSARPRVAATKIRLNAPAPIPFVHRYSATFQPQGRGWNTSYATRASGRTGPATAPAVTSCSAISAAVVSSGPSATGDGVRMPGPRTAPSAATPPVRTGRAVPRSDDRPATAAPTAAAGSARTYGPNIVV